MPYRDAVIPEVDPRVTAAIKEGIRRREEGIIQDKAKLKVWFQDQFFNEITHRTSQGGRDWVLRRDMSSPFCHLEYMKDREEVIRYLHETFIGHVKGLTATMSKNDAYGWCLVVRW